MTWTVEFDEAARKELRKLNRQAQLEILRYLRERIATDEDRFGKVLSRELAGLWHYRIQNYRIICNIEDQKLTVLVLRVGHRKDIYTD